MIKRSLFTACLLVVVPVQSLADSYVCVGEASASFRWTGERWAVTQPEAHAKVFIIQPSPDGSDYSVTPNGTRTPLHYCTKLDRANEPLFLTCGGGVNSFRFSARTLRFFEGYSVGYTDGVDSNANAPHMTIGKCTELVLRGLIE